MSDYFDLGSYTRRVTTDSDRAQTWFTLYAKGIAFAATGQVGPAAARLPDRRPGVLTVDIPCGPRPAA